MVSINTVLFLTAILLLLGIGSSKFSARIGMPMLVLFLGVGMLAGSEGLGRIAFEDYQLANSIGSVALALILFDGGLRTSMHSVRAVWRPALSLATLGVALTSGLTGVAAALVLDMPLLHGLLLGAPSSAPPTPRRCSPSSHQRPAAVAAARRHPGGGERLQRSHGHLPHRGAHRSDHRHGRFPGRAGPALPAPVRGGLGGRRRRRPGRHLGGEPHQPRLCRSLPGAGARLRPAHLRPGGGARRQRLSRGVHRRHRARQQVAGLPQRHLPVPRRGRLARADRAVRHARHAQLPQPAGRGGGGRPARRPGPDLRRPAAGRGPVDLALRFQPAGDPLSLLGRAQGGGAHHPGHLPATGRGRARHAHFQRGLLRGARLGNHPGLESAAGGALARPGHPFRLDRTGERGD